MLISITWGLFHQCPCSSNEPQPTLASQETLQDPQVGPAPAPMELLICPGSQCM